MIVGFHGREADPSPRPVLLRLRDGARAHAPSVRYEDVDALVTGAGEIVAVGTIEEVIDSDEYPWKTTVFLAAVSTIVFLPSAVADKAPP